MWNAKSTEPHTAQHGRSNGPQLCTHTPCTRQIVHSHCTYICICRTHTHTEKTHKILSALKYRRRKQIQNSNGSNDISPVKLWCTTTGRPGSHYKRQQNRKRITATRFAFSFWRSQFSKQQKKTRAASGCTHQLHSAPADMIFAQTHISCVHITVCMLYVYIQV